MAFECEATIQCSTMFMQEVARRADAPVLGLFIQ